MKFTWIAGPSFVLEVGPFRIFGDPVLANEFKLPDIGEVTRIAAPPSPALFSGGADLVLVTSLRADHFDPSALSRLEPGTVLAPLKTLGARALAWTESHQLAKEGMTLTITAVEASATGIEATEHDNGYFLRFEGGTQPFTAYVTGDTLFSEATRTLQREHGYSNLLVLYLGAERTGKGSARSAGAKDGMQIVYRMQPNAIAAVHHGTFSHYTEAIEPFLENIDLTIYEKRLRRLAEGESFEKASG